MKYLFVAFVIVAAIFVAKGDHLVIGNVANRVEVIQHELVEYAAIPFIKRVKQYFYATPNNKIIEGIQAIDTMHTKASINITSGGVGHSFVNLRMKSERGGGLSYDIGIYVKPDYL